VKTSEISVPLRPIRGRNILLTLLLASTNALFVFKYAGRIGFGFLAAIYVVLFLAMVYIMGRGKTKLGRLLTGNLFLPILILVCSLAVLTTYLLPANSRVARLPAISEWLYNLFHGTFPYGSSLNPSGFPVLFIIALPFYFLRNIGLLEAAGILLFGLAVSKNRKAGDRTPTIQFLIMLMLPVVYYEVITRSELFFNMSLALLIVCSADFDLTDGEIDTKFILLAAAMGMVLSTRLIVGPLYAIFVVYKFKRGIMKGFLFSGIVIFTFIVTLIPFLVWNADAFMSHGPFRIQFEYLPGWGVIATFAASVLFGFISKDLKDVITFAGITIFGVVALAFLLALSRIGIGQIILKDGFDVGYFILSAPFLLYGLDFRHDPRRHTSVDSTES